MDRKITLELLADGGCGGGSCPAVYRDSTGRLYIQGTKVGQELQELTNAAGGESVVEVSSEMLEVLRSL